MRPQRSVITSPINIFIIYLIYGVTFCTGKSIPTFDLTPPSTVSAAGSPLVYFFLIKIHTICKILVTRETISNLEMKLPSQQFLRIHRSYIVNLSKIDSYTNEFIEIEKNAIPISRTYKENVLKKLTKNSLK